MMYNSTRLLHGLPCVIMLTFLLCQANLYSKTTVFADRVFHNGHTDIPANTMDGNLSTKAGAGLIKGPGNYDSYPESVFSSPLQANTISPVKADTDDLLNVLFGGCADKHLAALAEAFISDSQEFTVAAGNDNTVVLSGNSTNSIYKPYVL